MRYARRFRALAGWLAAAVAVIFVGASLGFSRATETSGPLDRLKALASQAQSKHGWPALREFANSVPDSELRGEAHFALGYQEYEAGEYSPSADDFAAAERADFSLSDYADYYHGAALYQAHQVRLRPSIWRVSARGIRKVF